MPSSVRDAVDHYIDQKRTYPSVHLDRMKGGPRHHYATHPDGRSYTVCRMSTY